MYLEAIKEAGETVCILAFAMTLLMLAIWKLQRHKRQCQIDSLNKAADDLLLAQWTLPEDQEIQPCLVLEKLTPGEFERQLKQCNQAFTEKEIAGLYRVCQQMEKRGQRWIPNQ